MTTTNTTTQTSTTTHDAHLAKAMEQYFADRHNLKAKVKHAHKDANGEAITVECINCSSPQLAAVLRNDGWEATEKAKVVTATKTTKPEQAKPEAKPEPAKPTPKAKASTKKEPAKAEAKPKAKAEAKPEAEATTPSKAEYGAERSNDLPWHPKKVAVFKALKKLEAVGKNNAVAGKAVVDASNGTLTARDVRHYCYHAKAAGLIGLAEGEGNAYTFYLTAKGAKLDPDAELKKQVEAKAKAKDTK